MKYIFILATIFFASSCAELQVENITFNFDTSSNSSDALNIRQNYSTEVTIPEWQSDETSFEDSPAAYIGGKSITVLVRFIANKDGTYKVYTTNGPFQLKETLIKITNGVSGIVKMKSTIIPNKVSLNDVEWRWKRKIFCIFSREFDKTYHRFYTVLDEPNEPFEQTPYPNNQNPWAEALNYACSWANNEITLDGCAAKITENINIGPYSYDQISGATHYGSYSPRRYNLTAFIDRWNGGVGSGSILNCSDCAMSVTTFANLLGHQLWSSRMGWGFSLNPIVAVGYTSCACPNWGCSFSYHEVGWTGDALSTDHVYDACLKVDDNPSISPCTPLLPVNAIFDDPLATDYRERLVPASSISSCAALPSEKVRPAVY